jgi:hypothetical protein
LITQRVYAVKIGTHRFNTNKYFGIEKSGKCAVLDGKKYCTGYVVYFISTLSGRKPIIISETEFNQLFHEKGKPVNNFSNGY